MEGIDSTVDGRRMWKYLGSGRVRVQGQFEVIQKQLPNEPHWISSYVFLKTIQKISI